jgi:hypothetical protein
VYVYFVDIRDILLTFGTFCVHLVHFSGFGIRKIWQPCPVPGSIFNSDKKKLCPFKNSFLNFRKKKFLDLHKVQHMDLLVDAHTVKNIQVNSMKLLQVSLCAMNPFHT